MYLTKIKNEKETGKGHLEQDCLIAVIMIILQRDIKRAEELNYDLMGQVSTYASSSDCESAFNLFQHFREGNSEKFKKETTRASITTIFPVVIIRKLRELAIVAPVKK